MSFATAGLRIAQGLAERSAGLSTNSTGRIVAQGVLEDAAAGPMSRATDRVSNFVGQYTAPLIRRGNGPSETPATKQYAALQSHAGFRRQGGGAAVPGFLPNAQTHIRRFAPPRSMGSA